MMLEPNHQRGFTLLEALIAVGLLALMAVLLTPALASAVRASSSVIENASEREDIRVVKDSMTQILANSIIMDADDQDLQIRGDARNLQVSSLAGASVARRFIFRIENGELLADIRPLLDSDAGPVVTTTILSSGASSFSYYGRVAVDAPLGWTTRWTGSRPPVMVRFEMLLPEETASKLQIDMPVAADGPLHCQFDPVSRQCRS